MPKNQARKHLSQILNSGANIHFSKHAIIELGKDGLNTVDAINVLKSPAAMILSEAEFENGSYRYRVETRYLMVVVAFTVNGMEVIVVTAWDKRKRG